MTDWIKHYGGPQPVADNVEVQVLDKDQWQSTSFARNEDWGEVRRYRILNQHLIDAARLEGIREGLMAASALIALDPKTIAREAVLDQLTSEAQEQNMGYDKEADND